jgi:hypothetical protein
VNAENVIEYEIYIINLTNDASHNVLIERSVDKSIRMRLDGRLLLTVCFLIESTRLCFAIANRTGNSIIALCCEVL